MSRENRPVFVERATYHKRRMADAARVLPIVGIVLFLLPMLWLATDVDAEDGAPTKLVMAYLFVIWALLVALGAILSASLARAGWENEEQSGKEE